MQMFPPRSFSEASSVHMQHVSGVLHTMLSHQPHRTVAQLHIATINSHVLLHMPANSTIPHSSSRLFTTTKAQCFGKYACGITCNCCCRSICKWQCWQSAAACIVMLQAAGSTRCVEPTECCATEVHACMWLFACDKPCLQSMMQNANTFLPHCYLGASSVESAAGFSKPAAIQYESTAATEPAALDNQ